MHQNHWRANKTYKDGIAWSSLLFNYKQVATLGAEAQRTIPKTQIRIIV